MSRNARPKSQILLFPDGGEAQTSNDVARNPDGIDVVLCGSFRKDSIALRHELEELRDLGFRVLSPTNVNVVTEKDGFVFMEGEETETAESLEWRHLEAIQRASFVWLHAPDGYVGTSATLEVGFSRACGIPVYSRSTPSQAVLRPMVQIVSSPRDLIAHLELHPEPPLPAIRPFQKYYARAAVRRGYERESARDTLLLMLEEFGELARAIRKRQRMRRDGSEIVSQEAQELSDVFIYVVHMANVLGIDLGSAVQKKEQANIDRFLKK